jgi:hypothetical protein
MQAAATDAVLERAEREAMGSVSEFVYRMDRRQAIQALARVCPTKKGKNVPHGALTITRDGNVLLCGLCETREQVSRGEFEGLNREGYLPAEWEAELERRRATSIAVGEAVTLDAGAVEASELGDARLLL